jgi:hypothetical protein
MAKSKRSAALFEVIQSSRLPKNGQMTTTPRWWFKRSSLSPITAHTATQFTPSQTGQETLPEVFVAPPAIAQAYVAAPADEPSAAKLASAASVAPSSAGPSITIPPIAKQLLSYLDLQLDHDHHRVTFKLSYNSAIVTTFTLLVAIGLAFIVGKKMNHPRLAATSSPSSAELLAQPPHPEVLDVGKDSPPQQLIVSTHVADTAQLAAIKTPTTAPSSVDAQRVIGRQYVVIQIYPEKKNADDAAALLNKNDIPCTVENGLVGWASKSWWCVVGTTGFDHIRGNSEYEKYEAAVNRVSDQFAANSKFKKFEPRAYRWKESAT